MLLSMIAYLFVAGRSPYTVHTARAVMQAGFAMLEVGSVGAKHTKNMLVKVRVTSHFAAFYGVSVPFTRKRAGGT